MSFHKMPNSQSSAAITFCLFVIVSLAPKINAAELSQTSTRTATATQKPVMEDVKQARKELVQLKKLPDSVLKAKVESGDPLAGLALAHQTSSEAQTLTLAPTLANSAAEDAIRWYSLAARMNALQPRSINGMGVHPVRVTRNK